MQASQDLKSLAIAVRDTAYDPSLERSSRSSSSAPSTPLAVEYKVSNGRDVYKVWLFLEGPGVPFVQSVTYQLHPSFQPSTYTVARSPSNPNCTLIIWTWGIFDVDIAIRRKEGAEVRTVHKLGYDKYFASRPEFILSAE